MAIFLWCVSLDPVLASGAGPVAVGGEVLYQEM